MPASPDALEGSGEATEEPPQPHDNTTTSTTTSNVPLPPPDSNTFDKQPGHTYGSLKKLVEDQRPSPNSLLPPPTPVNIKPPSMSSTSHSSPPSSPTFSEERDWPSAPSTRPNSQPPSRAPSRAPSMSSGVSGNKLQPLTPTTGKQQTKPVTNGTATVQRSVSSGAAAPPPPKEKDYAPAPTPDLSSSKSTVRPPPKPASLHSNDGEKHKFTLKDLLASTPKLGRRSSQRSTGSSKRSDTESVDGDREKSAGGGGPKSRGARSTAGESTGSLSQKYGVCAKVAIGKGATSVVRLAHKWDRSEEKLYAVKEFRKRRKNESHKDYVKKLTSEFCISSTLHHPNIVETVDLVQDENTAWCEVMEFCPGGDLYAAIKKGGMSPSEVECCFKQMCRGVEYLHSQGVAHRDIKPENLFFDALGRLKIGDYGASTVYRLPWESTIHMSTGLCGSEPYIAPEQFLGKPYDARLVDIWACGIVYYCLHFSELPWRAAQPSDSLYQSYLAATQSSNTATASCPPTINNLSPRACRGLIRKMLEPNPKERATIEEVMKHAWLEGVEICWEVASGVGGAGVGAGGKKSNGSGKHVHVNAKAMAEAQLRELGKGREDRD
ncbi:serine threonine protein kinase [Moniliophthora roreri MCA 2997]|uniref:non-specific serine/threonine protein kinase n=1 Tax=Moniliophthora roreri (strain MCA 2997) TaxID=1381753 RepID=V2XZJ1_MONRO|nr:serine threonine protein kinase [Moniliophthora roreri MCA 2997]